MDSLNAHFSEREVGILKHVIMINEGFRAKVYRDSKGIFTIGCGFNLERPGAGAKLLQYGLDKESLMQGQEITKEQAQNLMDDDIYDAYSDARTACPLFDSLSFERKLVIIDLIYNLGKSSFVKFVKFIAAVQNQDWETAADELVDSNWYRQVKSRGVRMVSIMRTGVIPDSLLPVATLVA